MKRVLAVFFAASALLGTSLSASAWAKEPTAMCQDGTYSYSETEKGTCRGHGGVDWWINRPEK